MNMYLETKSHVDVTDMTSCSYYNCIYIGDRANHLIHRFDSLGSSCQLKLNEEPNGLSVTKHHTLLVACSSNKILELSTDGITIKEISLTGVANPRCVILFEGGKYLVTGDLPSAVLATALVNTRRPYTVFLVESTGIGNRLDSLSTSDVLKVSLDKHGCILILMTNNTVTITNVAEPSFSGSKEIISLAGQSLTGLDQMHFDMVHERLYLATSVKPELVVFKMD